MKLRMRFIVIMALFILSLTILATYISTRLLLSNALALERELVREAIEGGRHFLASEEKQFADITLDWARWDDAYQFMADTNSAFIDANLVDGTFQSLNLSAIAFFDRTGSLVYSKGYDLLSRTERPVHAFLLESLVRLPALRAPGNEPNALSGLLPIGTEIWMLAASPILTSSDGGPARGTLVMARRLDNLSDWCPSRHWHGMFTLNRPRRERRPWRSRPSPSAGSRGAPSSATCRGRPPCCSKHRSPAASWPTGYRGSSS
jgi:sensor domain CHASE-containing protein